MVFDVRLLFGFDVRKGGVFVSNVCSKSWRMISASFLRRLDIWGELFLHLETVYIDSNKTRLK